MVDVQRCQGCIDKAEQIGVLKDMLTIAECPHCDGSGVIANQVGDQEWEPEQCQWCFEKNKALEDIEKGKL